MTTFPEYESFDALGLAHLIQQKIVSPTELLTAAIERIEEHNPTLNAVVHKLYDEARVQIKTGLPQGPFTGVPFLLKDLLLDYAGTPLSSGSRYTRSWMSSADSELAKRLRATGVVVLGRTNVPEFGLSSVTEPLAFGPTLNPWDLSRSSGGSSGGAAAAIASGMVPMAHANDGAGSIRIPSSYCGLFGLKPSRGRTPCGSLMGRLNKGFVSEHVITRTVRDSAAMLDAIAGPELNIGISLSLPDQGFLTSLSTPCRPLNIAYMMQPIFAASISPEHITATQRTAALCQALGHRVSEHPGANFDSAEIALAYTMIVVGEMAATIQRFAKQLGHAPGLRELEPQTQLLIHIGKHITAADFAWAGDRLDQASQVWSAAFESYDVLLTPTMNAPVPKLGELGPTRFENSMMDVLARVPISPLLRKVLKQATMKQFSYIPFTPIFNINGQPAMSVPLYLDQMGMPLGMQFAAKIGDEATLLQLAKQLEEANPWPVMSAK